MYNMSYNKFCASSAPSGLDVEPAELFTYEYDKENNGICLLRYSGNKTNNTMAINEMIEEKGNIKLLIPDNINGHTVVGIDVKCFSYVNNIDVYFPDSLIYFKHKDS